MFDVYMLVAMLTQAELEESIELAIRYREVPAAKEIRNCAIELYGDINAPGMIELRRQIKTEIAYPLFREALNKILGV